MDHEKQIILSMNEMDAALITQILSPHTQDTALIRADVGDDMLRLIETGGVTRLIAFCSSQIVPASILKAVNYNALNFHPGPPDRPGYQPTSFAALEGARDFGVTFHKMTERVDEGEIIDARFFAFAPNLSLEEIEIEAYTALARLFAKHAQNLANVDFEFPPAGLEWSGRKTTRHELENRTAQAAKPHTPAEG